MKELSRGEVSTLRMVAGNEDQISKVIDGVLLKEWVGIGWVTLRNATDQDKKNYPTLIDN